MKFIVFPGQASQYPGMAKDWFDNFKEAQVAFEEASDFSGLNLSKLCFEGSEADLKATEITQPAILTSCIAIWRSLKNYCDLEKLKSDSLFAGHSLGEYSALVAMSALDLGPAAKFVRARGAAMQEAVPAGIGGMLALLFKPKTLTAIEEAQNICKEASSSSTQVWVANYNAAEQIVLAGHKSAIDKAQTIASSGTFNCRQAIPLEVSAPFHCPLMQKAADKLSDEIQKLEIKQSPSRYIANVDAKVYKISSVEEAQKVRERLTMQITASVYWTQSAEEALVQGARQLLEIGPKRVLSGLCKRVQKDGAQFEISNIDRKEDVENVKSILST